MTGFVQGVMYRKSTLAQAHELGLRGWVRNEPDGTVSGEAAGPTKHVELLYVTNLSNHRRDYLHIGPTEARVENVDVMFIKHHDISQSTLPYPFEIRT